MSTSTKSQIARLPTLYRVPLIPPTMEIPCKLLPSSTSELIPAPTDVIPPTITGAVFVSASEVSGMLWGPGELNPYLQFQAIPPKEKIASSILVFDGRFENATRFCNHPRE